MKFMDDEEMNRSSDLYVPIGSVKFTRSAVRRGIARSACQLFSTHHPFSGPTSLLNSYYNSIIIGLGPIYYS